MAKRMKVPVFHMEAGNRCYDFNVPEELNRRIIDHISDFNLVYTEHARRHLIGEGLPQRRIYLTGSPMKEVLDYYSLKIDNSLILKELKLEKQKYFVASVHREENVDNPSNLGKIVEVLNRLSMEFRVPVIVSTHPRTRKQLEKNGISTDGNSIRFLKPFSFTDYVHLQKHAMCTISDSGTISEESAMLSFPAISIRQSMERPEAQDNGTIILTGFNIGRVLDAVGLVIREHAMRSSYSVPADYSITDTSWRVLKLIQGNTGLSNLWHGIQ
jgi:UDP-N-acetylglucosamine 2-epimerase (non-hydrolysing)